MKILEIPQGSQSWLQWRKTIISATDSGSILNVNPYCDAMELRLRKLGYIPEKEITPAMLRGIEMEPLARDFFHRNNLDLHFTPAVIESSEYSFLGASLDGITVDNKSIIEIKCGEKSFEEASNNIIPNFYMSQMQHALIVTRSEICYYFAFNGKNGITIEVLPDPDFEEHYVPLAEQFWMDLIFKEPEIFKEKS